MILDKTIIAHVLLQQPTETSSLDERLEISINGNHTIISLQWNDYFKDASYNVNDHSIKWIEEPEYIRMPSRYVEKLIVALQKSLKLSVMK